MSLDRRHFLVALSAVTVGAMGLTRCSTGAQPRVAEATPVAVEQPPALLPPPPRAARIPLPGGGVLSSLPDDGDLLALTVDDGVNSDVVRLYTEFARDTGVRLTYFVNGAYRSWTENQALLRPLVDSGQIQLGNHTWSHPDLTKLPLTAVAEELRHTHDFLWKAYGTDARPYFRPPYGAHNANVDKISGELGYTADTLWSGRQVLHAGRDRDRASQPRAGHARLWTPRRAHPRASAEDRHPARRVRGLNNICHFCLNKII
jgi:peptidoglycan/xylan/chitin deacetylase (PgdA/CDA1 family)